MPTEDGIFRNESTKDFEKVYCEVWEELEQKGMIKYLSQDEIDNREILAITR